MHVDASKIVAFIALFVVFLAGTSSLYFYFFPGYHNLTGKKADIYLYDIIPCYSSASIKCEGFKARIYFYDSNKEIYGSVLSVKPSASEFFKIYFEENRFVKIKPLFSGIKIYFVIPREVNSFKIEKVKVGLTQKPLYYADPIQLSQWILFNDFDNNSIYEINPNFADLEYLYIKMALMSGNYLYCEGLEENYKDACYFLTGVKYPFLTSLPEFNKNITDERLKNIILAVNEGNEKKCQEFTSDYAVLCHAAFSHLNGVVENGNG